MNRPRAGRGYSDDDRFDRYDDPRDRRGRDAYGDRRGGGRSSGPGGGSGKGPGGGSFQFNVATIAVLAGVLIVGIGIGTGLSSTDRKSTRLNSSHT